MGPNNQYEAALWNVGQVVEPYDSDRLFPVFGFGGIPRYMNLSSVSHCFPLTGNPQQPEINGIENILQAYRSTLPNIQLSGPTYFGPILEQFLTYVDAMKNDMTYQILLLLTDGVINDFDRSKELIVKLSRLPCSIIIIGVGNADFSEMEALDGDDGLLRDSNGVKASRDIV